MSSEPQVLERPSSTSARAHERLERIGPGAARDSFLPLLQLADESEPQVRSYYQRGVLFVLRGEDRLVRGVTLAVPHANAVVELKAVERIIPVFEAQLLSYLRLTRTRVGLLLNFNAAVMRDGIKRMVL